MNSSSSCSSNKRRRHGLAAAATVHALPDAVLATILENVAALCGTRAVVILPTVCRRWKNVCREMVRLPRLILDFDLSGRLVAAPNREVISNLYLNRFKGIDSAKVLGYKVPSSYIASGGVALTSDGLDSLNSNQEVLVADGRISKCLELLLEPSIGLESLSVLMHNRSHVGDLAGKCSHLLSFEYGCSAVFLMGMEAERNVLSRAAERNLIADEDDDDSVRGDYSYLLEGNDHDQSLVNDGDLVNDEMLKTILADCSKLTRLSLGNFRGLDPEVNLTTGSGIRGCANLLELDLKKCLKIDDEGMIAICRLCPKLRRLMIGSVGKTNSVMTDTGVSRISTLSDLEVLDMESINTGRNAVTARSFVLIFGKCLKLNQIKGFFHSGPLVSKTITVFANNGRTFPSMVKVHLHTASINVSHVVQVCPKMKELWCRPSEGALSALQVLSQGCQDIESITLFWESPARRGVTDVAIQELANGCPKLKELSLHQDKCHVTDSGLKALHRACPGIHSISLENSCITDFGLFHLSCHVKRLKVLNVRGCSGVTLAGVLAVVKGCPNLRILIVSNVSEEWKKEIEREHPLIELDNGRY